MTWSKHASDALQAQLENMIAEAVLAERFGIEAPPAAILAGHKSALQDLLYRSIPLAKVMDGSDLVLHAEGPSVQADAPKLSAVNWVAGTAERTIRKLSGSLFDLLERDSKRLSRKLDLRMTGMASGSLYMGFAIGEFPTLCGLWDDEPVIDRIREAVRQLPVVTEAIDDRGAAENLGEIVPDPAERDATMSALHSLAPTGKRGIHTLDMSSPGNRPSSLSQRERILLADALRHPKLLNKHHGRFTGEVREIDLDARRIHLRGTASGGSLRCVLPELTRDQAKLFLGEQVQVSGEYETNKQGRPRLILVDEIRPVPRLTQLDAF